MKKEKILKRHEMYLNVARKVIFKHNIASATIMIVIGLLGGKIANVIGVCYPIAKYVILLVTLIIVCIVAVYTETVMCRKLAKKLSEFTERIEANNTSDETE